jgi:hypothetical protein
LPRQSSYHIGIALTRTLYKKLSSYGVTSNRIRWFVANNALDNDTCLKALSDLLKFKVTKRRLRCAGHIFNLVAHSILFSIDNANLKLISDAIYNDDILSLELAKWRVKGLIRKLYNLMLWIRRLALHRERL